MSGHANEQQQHRIRELDQLLRTGAASADECLELALLSLEPGHDGFRAVELLKRIPANHPLRNVWLAFADIYEIMDLDALNEAVAVCTEVLLEHSDIAATAAALMLRAAAQRQLSNTLTARADCEASVRLAPHWVGNRQLLSQILTEQANYEAAREELNAALKNVRPIPTPEKYADYMFERLITARLSQGIDNRLRTQLNS
jgi:tetratricopeptide (TPR) repeat protein